ncbi:MAG: HNH endonuclease family protein [Oscillospiraceae bacterium]|nr:HNH endonuclease family protein [Oscillospiraceae bacterium]
MEEEAFAEFLDKITGFIWTYAVTTPGVNALRTPVYAEMLNIVNSQPVTFAEYRFDEDKVRSMFNNFSFHNARPITKAMLTWWAFTDDRQELLSLENVYEIEHIYARNRQDKEKSLSNPGNLNALGNKVLLEKRINIRAADYRFVDKKKYYNGFINSRGQAKEGTKIQELIDLAASTDDFTESDIIARTENIMNQFLIFLKSNSLTI